MTDESFPNDLERLADGEAPHGAENFQAVLDALETEGGVILRAGYARNPTHVATHEDGYFVAVHADERWHRYVTDHWGDNLVMKTQWAEEIEAVPPEETRLYRSGGGQEAVHQYILEGDE